MDFTQIRRELDEAQDYLLLAIQHKQALTDSVYALRKELELAGLWERCPARPQVDQVLAQAERDEREAA